MIINILLTISVLKGLKQWGFLIKLGNKILSFYLLNVVLYLFYNYAETYIFKGAKKRA